MFLTSVDSATFNLSEQTHLNFLTEDQNLLCFQQVAIAHRY
nr:hypothetical protein [Okeania sp. SIO2F4]